MHDKTIGDHDFLLKKLENVVPKSMFSKKHLERVPFGSSPNGQYLFISLYATLLHLPQLRSGHEQAR